MIRKILIRVVATFIVVLIPLLLMEVFLRLQNFVELDNFSNKYPWNSVFHHGNGELVVKEYGSSCNEESIKILLLGDSWMEDEDLSRSIGEEVVERSGKCVKTVNGGNSSYSPTIYLLKARQAFNSYGKFDFIVVNIDETDIGDEWIRYRIPTVRDISGKIVAVPYEHDLHSQFTWNGKLWAEKSNLYIVRFVRFTIFHKVLIPMLYRLTSSPEYSSLMKFLFAPDARFLYKKEHDYFYDRLLEMETEISNYTNGPKFIYVTHHPHYRGLVGSVDDGQLYLPIISEEISRLKEEVGVTVLDARNYVKQIHGEDFQKNTFEKNDPFSHLVGEGAIRYGRWIGSQIDLSFEIDSSLSTKRSPVKE